MELFWKTGFNGTSIQDLVAHLGINRGSLYDTFGGKDALFEKAFAHYQKQNTEATRTLLHQAPSVKEGFRKLFLLSVEQSVNDPDRKGCFVVNTTTERIPENGEWLDILNRNRLNFEQLFYQQLKKGVEKGEISPEKDLKALAAFLFTLYNGLKVVAKINPSKEELMRIVDEGLKSV